MSVTRIPLYPESELIRRVAELGDEISRAYDDKKFNTSFKRQFEAKGSLSDKQRAVLRRMAGKYASQIPDELRPAPRGEAGSGE